jgi:hypothetical protein
MTDDQTIELLAKLERIAVALEKQVDDAPQIAAVVTRIACALEKEPPSPPIPSRK